MNKPRYDPAKHHRRSIRLKEHDYAGIGIYFVTICAHQEFIEFAQGNPFAVGATRMSPPLLPTTRMSPEEERATCVSPEEERATCVSPVREIIAQEWKRCGELRDDVFPGPFAVMLDHFHGLISINKGQSELGHVIGAFKAATSRRIRRGDTHVALSSRDTHVALSSRDTHVALSSRDTHVAPPKNTRIWHRNYYEMIVRTPEAERNITEYIRMNPWKLIQNAVHNGQSFRMIGNPTLLNREKIAMLCSRNCPPEVLQVAKQHAQSAGQQHCFMSGFHSPPEKAILEELLRHRSDSHIAPKLICCPAWGIDTMRIPSAWLAALEANRMLILEMRDRAGDLAAAEARNRFVLEQTEKRWIPHVSTGGMLDRLLREGKAGPARFSGTRIANLNTNVKEVEG